MKPASICRLSLEITVITVNTVDLQKQLLQNIQKLINQPGPTAVKNR